MALSEQDAKVVHAFPIHQYKKWRIPHLGFLYLDDINDYVKNYLKYFGAWEPYHANLIKKHIKPGTVVVDIGAHIGTHTISMAQAVGDEGLVISFEPQAKIYSELVMNIRLNGHHNVLPIRRALGEKEQLVSLGVPVEGNEGARFVADQMSGGSTTDGLVTMKTLDSFNLNDVSFIKIDVENLEGPVLRGARETIMRNRPVMLIEIGGGMQSDYDKAMRGRMNQDTIATIQGMNYRVVQFHNCDYLALPLE